MKRVSVISIIALMAIFAVGCDKKGPEKAKFERIEFDAPEFAINLGENFEE